LAKVKSLLRAVLQSVARLARGTRRPASPARHLTGDMSALPGCSGFPTVAHRSAPDLSVDRARTSQECNCSQGPLSTPAHASLGFLPCANAAGPVPDGVLQSLRLACGIRGRPRCPLRI